MMDLDGWNEYAAWKFQESNIPGQQFGGKEPSTLSLSWKWSNPFIDENYRTKADRKHTA